MTAPAQRKDPCWARYPETVLEIYHDGIHRVDLRKSLLDADRGALRDLGLGDRFAVVTAANPRGQAASDAENHVRAEKLDNDVVAAGLGFLRADGVSPDGSHREVGVAVAASRLEAAALAARHEQSAMFWFDGERFWIVPVLETGAEPLALPALWREELT